MTRSKNQHLLQVVDEFSRFPFAFPLRSHRNSKTTAAKMKLRPPKLSPTILKAMAKTNPTTELCGRPFCDCYTLLTAHSLTAKTNTFSQWWMSLVGFRSPSLSGTLRLVASRKVLRHFLLSAEPTCSFTPDRVIGIPKLRPPNWNCELQNYALPSSRQWPKRTLQWNGVKGRSVTVTLR